MRGTFYNRAIDSAEFEGDRNARENKAKQDAGNGPQVIVGPNTVAQPEDARAIVAIVAHKILQSELDWSTADVLDKYPALVGLTSAQIAAAITEALS